MKSEIVDETETASKFKWRDPPDAGVVLVVKFYAKEMLKHVLIRARIEGWAETVRGDHCRAGKHGFVRVTTVEEVFERHPRRRNKGRWGQRGREFQILAHEVVVVHHQRDRMFRPIEWLPK